MAAKNSFAQTARQVIIQGMREAERGMIFDEFSAKKHEILTGSVTRVDKRNGSGFAPQLLHHGVHPLAPGAHAGPDGVHVLVVAPHGQLGAAIRPASAPEPPEEEAAEAQEGQDEEDIEVTE